MFPGIVMGWADAAVIEASAARANATRLFMTIPLSRARGVSATSDLSRPCSHPDHDITMIVGRLRAGCSGSKPAKRLANLSKNSGQITPAHAQVMAEGPNARAIA
jgi:hypothetical protein